MAHQAPEKIGTNQSFGGQQLRYKHQSAVLNCEMTFSIYLPPQVEKGPVPVLYWLSGLTCTDENFVQKAGSQQYAAEHGIAILCPDTSPRGEGVADDPDAAYDMGLGAGFYVDATQQPWASHYQMYSYIVDELPALINAQFPVDANRVSISGHSMGGHGALSIALKNPGRFKSVSAFSPICSPLNCPWGDKTLGNYLGADKSTWAQYDTVALVAEAKEHLPVLVDQGEADNFLDEQLKTPLLIEAANRAGFPMDIRMQPEYDHSYFFIATFIAEHMAFHARALAA
ncbi:MAG: S-formylglutathione hydrolase [Porticoccaceae bacterium]|jgi:S-formylglutathione hydrolase|nr:S-formylglutathione hydrolase [Porticoccaceae bacterium]MBT5578323.1 S-formylglutathione hydrolase [Porticoccaceae bacterium]MBT7375075.1 S-formylglutathione hydrolase [Porticoccaceae bacterium]